MNAHHTDPLALSTALTAKTKQFCLGLEHGAADILELVTPTTAELLHWWFGQDMVDARGGLNFHQGQKQAILNAIVAHEVLGAAHLKDLYQQVAPDALLVGTRLAEVSAPKHAHPKYCFKMATGTGKTWVLQALLIRCAANPAVQGRVKSADGKAVLVVWIGFNAASAAARCTGE